MTLDASAAVVLEAVLAHVTAEDRLDALHGDPLAAVEAWPDLEVRYVSDAKIEDVELVGSYDAESRTVQIAEDANAGRKAFTAIHELGHHLQQQTLHLIDLLATHAEATSDGIEVLEERVCDMLAARILFPPAMTSVTFADGVTGSAILELARNSSGSLAAACVEAANHLPGPGQVILLSATGRVDFRSAANSFPVGRGTDQSRVRPIAQALQSTSPVTGIGRFVYRDGIEGEEQHVQVTPVNGRFLVIAVTDRPAWAQGFVLPTGSGRPVAPEWSCPHCDEEYESFDVTCPRCGQPPCPACDRCACELHGATRQCTSCWLVHPLSMFEGEDTHCKDCA